MKKGKVFIFVIISVIILVMFFTKFNFDNSRAFSSILTFLSVIVGFSITGLSIIAASNFSKELYAMESKKNNSQTLLHELISIFSSSTLLFTTTIILILLYQFLPKITYEVFTYSEYVISGDVIMKGFIWYFTILSFATFIYLLSTFSKFIIKSVSGS